MVCGHLRNRRMNGLEKRSSLCDIVAMGYAWANLIPNTDRPSIDSIDNGDTLIATYEYNGQHRRIAKCLPDGENWDRTDYYYNTTWQCLEERFVADQANRQTPATAARVQTVWDLRYIDAVVCRFRDSDANGSLDETL